MAHTESLRLQRILIERVLDSAGALPLLSTPAAAAPVAASSPGEETPSDAAPVPTVQAARPSEPLRELDEPSPAPVVAGEAEAPHTAELPNTPDTAAGDQQQISAPRSSGGAPLRGDRYYQSARPGERAPARPISPAGLDVLRCIQAAGDVAHLVLTFGPHAGEPLGQVAQSDPDYLRELARTAQRPDVRAAAARLVEALPSSHPPHGRRTSTRTRRGAWRGAS